MAPPEKTVNAFQFRSGERDPVTRTVAQFTTATEAAHVLTRAHGDFDDSVTYVIVSSSKNLAVAGDATNVTVGAAQQGALGCNVIYISPSDDTVSITLPVGCKYYKAFEGAAPAGAETTRVQMGSYDGQNFTPYDYVFSLPSNDQFNLTQLPVSVEIRQ